MKRIILSILLNFVFSLSFAATERVAVLTDRSAYICGDRVWCSIFCVDENGALSSQSAIAYLELVSSDGTSAEAKIALFEGRGAGEFVIPANTPTGNYRLMAYTSLEGGEQSMMGSRLISVYNPLSLARVKNGVVTGQAAEAVLQQDCREGISLQVQEKVGRGEKFNLFLRGAESDLTVSVYHENELAQLPNGTLAEFMGKFPVSSEAGGPVEFDGEIIRGRVLNSEEDGMAILSSSGSSADIYVSPVGDGSSIQFETDNLYGDRELVCEMLNAGDNIRIQLASPFQHPSAGELPALRLHDSQREALSAGLRSVGARGYISDTLVRFLPRREDRFLRQEDMTRIHLDDYTRFLSIQEIVVEILPMVRIRKHYGKKQLELQVADGASSRKVYMDHILVMMDGVIISDFDLLLPLDAMLLEDIYIYSGRIVIGPAVFNGAINFVSKKNYVTALDFPSSVCVVDYKGVSYPVAYLGETVSGEDSRQLLYWNPALLHKEDDRIVLTAPDYPGRFCIVAEGLSPDGKAVRAVTHFDVE